MKIFFQFHRVLVPACPQHTAWPEQKLFPLGLTSLYSAWTSRQVLVASALWHPSSATECSSVQPVRSSDFQEFLSDILFTIFIIGSVASLHIPCPFISLSSLFSCSLFPLSPLFLFCPFPLTGPRWFLLPPIARFPLFHSSLSLWFSFSSPNVTPPLHLSFLPPFPPDSLAVSPLGPPCPPTPPLGGL